MFIIKMYTYKSWINFWMFQKLVVDFMNLLCPFTTLKHKLSSSEMSKNNFTTKYAFKYHYVLSFVFYTSNLSPPDQFSYQLHLQQTINKIQHYIETLVVFGDKKGRGGDLRIYRKLCLDVLSHHNLKSPTAAHLSIIGACFLRSNNCSILCK